MTRLQSPCPDGWTKYGWMAWPNHRGRDWGWYFAHPIKSRKTYFAAAGIVVQVDDYAGWNDGWGNRILVQHAPGFVTAYNHYFNGTVSKFTAGQMVEAGQLIGSMGNTGDTKGTIHLHFEVWHNGVRVDPDPWFAKDIPQPVTPAEPKPPTPITEDTDMPRIYHQVNTDGNQAYIVEGNYGFDIVSTDHAKAICKAWQIDFTTLVKINEFDFNALAEAKRKDVGRMVAIVSQIPSSGGATPEQVAAAVDKALADDFAAVRADVNRPRTVQ